MLTVSTAGLLAHRSLLEATPLAVAAWRLAGAALFFSLWGLLRPENSPLSGGSGGQVAIRGRRPSVGGQWSSVVLRLVGAGVFLALHFLTWFASLQTLSVARSTLLVSTTPLWTAFLGLLLGRQRPGWSYWLALLLAGVGTWLVTWPGPGDRGSLDGSLLALAGGLAVALYLLCCEGLHEEVSTRRQVTLAYTTAAAVLWTALATEHGVRLSYSAGAWAALAGMTLGPQILGHTLINNSLRHFPSSTVAFAVLLEPVFAGLLAWILLGQSLTPLQLLGGMLVLGGMAMVLRRF